jgi:hypothetical protein
VHYKRLEILEDVLYLHALGQKSDVRALGLDCDKLLKLSSCTCYTNQTKGQLVHFGVKMEHKQTTS